MTKIDGNGDSTVTVSDRSTELVDAVRNEASAEELAECQVPSTYVAAYLSREDEGMFQGESDRDVRRSIRVGEIPVPALAPDEVLIAVMASSINYNTVWSATFEPIPTFRFLERLGREEPWYAHHDLPYHAIGTDAAGIVVQVGVGVRRWSVGDRVVAHAAWIDEQDPISQVDGMLCEAQRAWGFETNFGGLAEFAVVKANQLLPKPRHLTWEEAGCNIACAMSAYRMLVSPRGAQFKQGDIVLVWGAAGGLGAYALQYIHNGGGISVGVVGSEERAKLLERLKCDLVLRRDELELDGLDEVEMGKRVGKEIRRRFGEDPHIVFEHVGRRTFGASVYAVRRGGTVVTCGSSTGHDHQYDNRRLWMRVKRVVGSHIANWQEAAEANRLIQMGKIMPALSKLYTLERVGEAAREVQLNRHVGKVGVLCLAEREGLGVEDPVLRASIGEERLRLFREFG
jgi:crotonyl-CoA reductase